MQQSREEEEEFRRHVRIVKKKKTKFAWKLNVVAVANFDECVCGNCNINCFKFENH